MCKSIKAAMSGIALSIAFAMLTTLLTACGEEEDPIGDAKSPDGPVQLDGGGIDTGVDSIDAAPQLDMCASWAWMDDAQWDCFRCATGGNHPTNEGGIVPPDWTAMQALPAMSGLSVSLSSEIDGCHVIGTNGEGTVELNTVIPPPPANARLLIYGNIAPRWFHWDPNGFPGDMVDCRQQQM
jgi:hypothetical protein